MDKKKILDKIAKLNAKAVGATGAEAAAFAAKVTDLLQRYNLSLSEVDLNEQRTSDVVRRKIFGEQYADNDSTVMDKFALRLLTVIAKKNGVECFATRGTNTMTLIGRSVMVEGVKKCFVLVYRFLADDKPRMRAAFAKVNGSTRGFAAAYDDGFVSELSRRLDEIKSGGARMALIIADDKAAVQKFLRGAKAVSTRSRRDYNADAYAYGVNSAARAPLNDAIGVQR